MSAKVLASLPLAVVLLISAINPDFMRAAVHRPRFGHKLLDLRRVLGDRRVSS